MLGWLASRFSPATDARASLDSVWAVRGLISKLDAETPQYVLTELAKQFKDTPEELFRTPRGFRSLQQLDEYAQRPLEALWGTLLADSLGQGVSEAVWGALTNYYRRTYTSYWNRLGVHSTSEAIPKRERAEAMLAASRALAALAKYLLLLRLRYFSAPEETWSQVRGLMHWVEQQGCATDPVQPYSGVATTTTIERELLAVLLLEVAPTADLMPGQILALDCLLRSHIDRCGFSERYDAQASPFVFDRSRSEPPRHFLRGMKTHPDIRYFGLGAVHAALRDAADEARRGRNLPQWLGQTRCSVDDYAEMLERLFAHWPAEPQRPRERREPCTDEILVAHDLRTICRLVKFSELAISGQSLSYDTSNVYRNKGGLQPLAESAPGNARPDPGVTAQDALLNLATFEKSLDRDAIELWTLSHTSESGLGAKAETDCPWVRLGMVVAYRRRESAEWQIATVRRLNRSMHGWLSIGMARITSPVSSARLWPGIDRKDYTRSVVGHGSEIEYEGLMLKDAVSALLLPIGVLDQTQKYTLTYEGRQRVVKMEKSLGRAINFERVEISEVTMLRAA